MITIADVCERRVFEVRAGRPHTAGKDSCHMKLLGFGMFDFVDGQGTQSRNTILGCIRDTTGCCIKDIGIRPMALTCARWLILGLKACDSGTVVSRFWKTRNSSGDTSRWLH